MNNMRKVLFLAALVLISTMSFGQKKNVTRAKNLCLAEEGADFDAARSAIFEALENEETKDQAQTWYVAGLIEYQDYMKQLASRSEDYRKMGEMVVKCLDYWAVADSLAMLPQKDKKGNVIVDKKGNYKYDTKTRKDMADRVLDYYRNQMLIAYGGVLYSDQDYAGASRMYKMHTDLANLPMMQTEKLQAQMVRDTTYKDFQFDAARLAYYAKEYDRAIDMFRVLVEGDWKQILSGEFLYQCYMDKGDTITANQILDECIRKFPGEAWFLQNMINNLVNGGRQAEAIAYLQKAIEMDPQGQYYNSLGSILSLEHRFDEAFEAFAKAIATDPNNAQYQQACGFGYIDMVNMYEEQASAPGVDDATYKSLRNKSQEAKQNALKYFEKAYQLEPNNDTYRRDLRRLYYQLGMMDMYNSLAD